VFKKVETSIARGSVQDFANHLGPKVQISVGWEKSGFYSANQAFYVLQEYFNGHYPAAFTFESYGQSPTNPYAAGRLDYNGRFGRSSAHIYVALSLVENQWKISQINISN
jgi:hypothetical protein